MAEIESPSQPDVAVVLVTADWAGPARPAETVLRELSRRWGDAVRAVVVDASQDEILDLLGVDVVPTWLRFIRVTDQASDGSGDPGSPAGPASTPPGLVAGADATEVKETGAAATGAAGAPGAAGAAGAAEAAGGPSRIDEHLILRDLPVASSTGDHTVLAGTWRLTKRRTGALPKHDVAREFGPARPAVDV